MTIARFPASGPDAGREMLLDRGEDRRRLGEASEAGLVRLRHLAALRADELDAVGLELRDVPLRRRMRPHLRVHRRRDEHRPVGREQHRRGEIVGKPVRHLGQKVGGRRRDDDEVGLAREADVADLVLVVEVEEILEDALAGDGGDRERRHEMMRRAAHRGAHRGARLLQAADQLQHLVGGDAAADDDQNAAGRTSDMALA